MDVLQKIAPLFGRIALATIFLASGVQKLFNFGGTTQYMEKAGMIFPSFFLVGAIILLLFGSISVLLGYKVRYGALALIIFLIPATLIFHTDFSDPMQPIHFMKNLSILGGLLMIISLGAGGLSMDNHSERDDRMYF